MGRPKIRWAHYDSDPIEDEWEDELIDDQPTAPDTQQPEPTDDDTASRQDDAG